MIKIPLVDLHAQYVSIKEPIDNAIADVIRKGSFILGESVFDFEKAFANKIGVGHCVSCGNGTDALCIALKQLGIRTGDEVITTAHSWIATSESISHTGAKVVFCDTDYETFTISPKEIEKKLTTRTKGIIPVHLYGQAADMDPIMSIAHSQGLWVLEDCAQAHLAKYKDRYVGTFGDAAIFSFYPGKNLGAMGDAGCIVTNNDELSERMSLYARHGGKGVHLMEGVNSRMDEIQAAVLNVKLGYLDGWNEARRLIARQYDELLNGLGDILTPVEAQDMDHVYHLYVIRTSQRDALKQFLKNCGIGSAVHYPVALPFLSAYARSGHTKNDFPIAFSNQTQILSLPMYPELSRALVAEICAAVQDFFETQKVHDRR